MQLEGDIARQHHDIAGQGLIEDLHAVGQRFIKAFFFGLQHLRNALGLRRETWVGLAHQRHQIGHQSSQKNGLLPQFVAVADGADDAALHVATPFVARQHAVADQEGGGADVVGDDAQALVAGRCNRSRAPRP